MSGAMRYALWAASAVRNARFSRFAVVGALGTAVNLLTFYVAREWLLPPSASSLLLAQLLALAVATVHNFLLNRAWTWVDRSASATPTSAAFVRYLSVAGLSIGLQLLCVQLLSDYVHYALAAAIGIGLASVGAYLLNDKWSFADAQARRRAGPSQWLGIGLAGMVAVGTYFYAIDSQMIPKNGDENVYLHITRMTNAQANWLPLQSGLEDMRNTKPPMLFWQGRLSVALANGGWDIAVLRLPSVLYTLATAGVLAWMVTRLGGAPMQAALAALLWLGCLSTFRYGRPYLTNPGEVFFLFSALALLVAGPREWLTRHWRLSLALGVLVGMGLLYKSFVLLLPAGLGLALARQMMLAKDLRDGRAGLDCALWAAPIAVVSLAMFCIWPALDPQPSEIWREFVVGENMGKLARANASWFQTALSGSDSLAVYAVAAVLNAGPLMVVVTAGFLIATWALLRRQLPAHERALLCWILLWLIVFALPSQRSARYLLPAMPAVAAVVALRWSSLPAWLLRLNWLLILAVLVLIGLLAGGVREAVEPMARLDWATWGLLAASTGFVGWGVLRPQRWMLGLPVAALATYACLSAAFRPMDRSEFGSAAKTQTTSQTVAVPCNFRGKFEEYQFAWPQSKITGYFDTDGRFSAAELAAQYPLFVIRTALGAPAPACVSCQVLGNRFVVRSRHNSDEIKAMLRGEVAQHLVAREWLVRAPAPVLAAPSAGLSRLQAHIRLPANRCL